MLLSTTSLKYSDVMKEKSVQVGLHTITTSRRFKCVPQILGSLSIHIFKLLFSFVEQFPTTEHVSEDRRAFEVGEIFYLLF